MHFHRYERTAAAAFIVLYPSLALAHGEWILLLPFGQLIALIASGVLAKLLTPRGSALIIWVIAFGVCLGTWLLPKPVEKWLVGGEFPPTGSRLFAIGFLPVIVVALLSIVFARWRSSTLKGKCL
jgi:hypothetical protein